MMIFGVWLTIVCSPPPAWLLRITRAALQTKGPRCSVCPWARLGAPFHTPFIGSGLGELCKQGRQPEMSIQTPDLPAFIRQLRAFGMIFSLHFKNVSNRRRLKQVPSQFSPVWGAFHKLLQHQRAKVSTCVASCLVLCNLELVFDLDSLVME